MPVTTAFTVTCLSPTVSFSKIKSSKTYAIRHLNISKRVSSTALNGIRNSKMADLFHSGECKLFGTLTTDLSAVPKSESERIHGADGNQYYKVSYTLEATFYSADIKVELEFKGRRYSTAYLAYANAVTLRPSRSLF